ncbi:WD40-repeat-containing domain protein [Pelagophyceae sp. CCMP2097]|nr:WD40-repeat-containing domain protein [Pelagophyceae sp. CCMP2097]
MALDASAAAPVRGLVGHTGRCFDCDVRDDDAGGALAATASEDGTARVWELASGACCAVLEGQKDEVLRVAWAPRLVEEAAGAPLLATAGADGAVRLWRGAAWAAPDSRVAETPAPRLVHALAHASGEQVYGCAWTSGDEDGAWLVTAAGDEACVWDVGAGAVVRSWRYADAAAARGRKRRALAGGAKPRDDDTAPCIFDVKPAGALVACALSDGTVRVSDVRAPEPATRLESPGTLRLTAISWRHDGLAACAGDGSISIWDARTWTERLRLRGAHSGPAYGCAWRPREAGEAEPLLSWSSDGVLAWWDAALPDAAPGAAPTMRVPTSITEAPAPDFSIFHCAFDSAGDVMVCVGGSGAESTDVNAYVYDVSAARNTMTKAWSSRA